MNSEMTIPYTKPGTVDSMGPCDDIEATKFVYLNFHGGLLSKCLTLLHLKRVRRLR